MVPMLTKCRLAWIFAAVTASAAACSSDDDASSGNAAGRGGSKAGAGGSAGRGGGGGAVGGSSGAESAGHGGGGSGTGGSAGVADAGPDSVPPLVCPDGGAPSGFHVSPNGSSSGNGSVGSPWDLTTALNQPSSVQPGATIWLHAGTYRGNFTS